MKSILLLTAVTVFSSLAFAGGGPHDECTKSNPKGCSVVEFPKSRNCPYTFTARATSGELDLVIRGKVTGSTGDSSTYACDYRATVMKGDQSGNPYAQIEQVQSARLYMFSGGSDLRLKAIVDGQMIDLIIFESYFNELKGEYKLVGDLDNDHPATVAQELAYVQLDISAQLQAVPHTIEVPFDMFGALKF